MSKQYKTAAGGGWLWIVTGLCVSAGVAAASVVLGVQYLESRPENLCAQSTELADALGLALTAGGIAPERVQRTRPEPLATEWACWLRTAFHVSGVAPAQAEALAGRVRAQFEPAGIAVSDEVAGRTRALRLALGASEAAVVTLEDTREDMRATCEAIAGSVLSYLASRGISVEPIAREVQSLENDQHLWTCTRLKAPIPEGFSAAAFEAGLQQAVSGHGAQVTARIGVNGSTPFAVYLGNLVSVVVELTRDFDPIAAAQEAARPRNGRLALPEDLPLDSIMLDDLDLSTVSPESGQEKKGTPRVAILVDDGGYGGAVTEAFLKMDPGLTLALMPGGTRAAETSKRAIELGFEVILHLPMEHELGPEWLNMDMSQEEIRRKTEDAIARVPGLVGINSHMGSLFTANQQAVDRFINVIKDKPYYFVDSRTTAKSKILDAARAAGIKAASRDVFLDNEKDLDYIRKQFAQLIKIALKRGQAVGICHFRKNTAAVMPELLPLLKQNGIELVHASELVR